MSVKTRQGLFPVNVRTLAPPLPPPPLCPAPVCHRANRCRGSAIMLAGGLRLRWLCGGQVDHIDATQITQTSKMVSSYTGMIVQPNKAIVGANAFAHEAGIHQDGVLKNPLTYEIMTPESVGLNNTNLVLGKHSGRAAFNDRMQDLGFQVHCSSLSPFCI